MCTIGVQMVHIPVFWAPLIESSGILQRTISCAGPRHLEAR